MERASRAGRRVGTLKRHAPSMRHRRGASITGSARRPDSALSEAQYWVLAVGALLTHLQGGNTRLFGGGVRVRDAMWARQVLAKNAVHSVEDAYRALNDWLAHIPDHPHVSRRTDENGSTWVAFRQGAQYCLDENDPTAWHGLSQLGWNLMRACNIAGLAHVACLLPAEQAWQIATFAARIVQNSFQSWDELWDGAKAQLQVPDVAGRSAREALKHEGNAWTLPWNVPLRSEVCPDPRTVWVVSCEPQPNTHTFAHALAQARPGDRLELRAGTYVGPWHLHKSIEIVGNAGTVICRAPEDSPASVVLFDGFARLAHIEIIAPGDSPNGQVAVTCMAGAALIEHTKITSAGHGINVAPAARVILRNCTIDGCQLNGVVSHGELEAERCVFQNSTYHAAIVDRTSRATFTHCAFTCAGTHLLGVEGDSSARVVDCTFDDSAQAALVVTTQSSLDVIRCRVTRGGVVAAGAKRCTFVDSQFDNVPQGFEAQQQIAVLSEVEEAIITRCDFQNACHIALHLSNCGSVFVERTRLTGGNGCGLLVTSNLETSTLSAQDSTITTVHGDSAAQLQGGTATFSSCQFSGGAEITIVATRSALTLQDCELVGAHDCALLACEHAHLFARGLRIWEPQCSAIRIVDAMAHLLGCGISGQSIVVLEVRGTASANLVNCTFGGEGEHSMTLDGPGPVTAQMLSIEDTCQLDLHAHDGAHLCLAASTIASCRIASITLGEDSTLVIQDCPNLNLQDVALQRSRTARIHPEPVCPIDILITQE